MPKNTDTILSNWKALPNSNCQLAESPRYAHGVWCWVDIDGKKIFRCQTQNLNEATSSNIEVAELPDQVGCVLPTKEKNSYALFGRKGTYLLNWGSTSTDIHIENTSPFDPNTHRFNDGHADAKGRAWVSSLSDAREPTAALYEIDQKQIIKKYEPLIVGNGLTFSPDQKVMYLADTRQKKIWRFEFDATSGTISHQALFADYTHEKTARPDGATVAENGDYLVAVYEGYRLDRYNANGKLIEHIQLPLAKPTMPCFGGPNLQQLLVTAAAPSENFHNQQGFEHCNVIYAQSSLTGCTENLFTLA